MTETLLNNLETLPGTLASHLLITVLPLTAGLALSLPLAVLAVRAPRFRYPTLTALSVVQTIPSLALLALMVPVLAAVGWVLATYVGVTISALGFYPTVIALTLYSMLPSLRNMVTGILDVDPALTEAARGVGMTPWQTLWKVELPLALPVIIAGIRTATVWTVGIATLATPVGQRCLGNYIFRGLQTRDWITVLFGCVAAAVLAILLDLLIGALQKAADQRRRGLALWAGSGLALVFVVGLIGPTSVDLVRDWQRAERAVAEANGEQAADSEAPTTLVVGSKTFTEQYILSELIVRQLRTTPLAIEKKESLGSTVLFDGLAQGEIDCYVDYTGTIWANHMNQSGAAPPWKVLDMVAGWLARKHDVRCLGPLGFENAYALAMRRDRAEELGIRTIGDLAEHSADMTIGGDYEFFGRPEWQAVRDAYGLQFDDRTTYDSTFMYDSLVRGEVDVISAFSSDGRIKAFDLVTLEDPKNAIPPYDAILLLSPEAANLDAVAEALRPLIGRIDVDTMREANYLVDREEDKKTIRHAADWLGGKLGVLPEGNGEQSADDEE